MQFWYGLKMKMYVLVEESKAAGVRVDTEVELPLVAVRLRGEDAGRRGGEILLHTPAGLTQRVQAEIQCILPLTRELCSPQARAAGRHHNSERRAD